MGSDLKDGLATRILRNVHRANPNLLVYSSDPPQWSLEFSATSLYFRSVESRMSRLREGVRRAAHSGATPGSIYFLNWRKGEESYLKNYYQQWSVLREPELAETAASLLLQGANNDRVIGPLLPKLVALISVTASAGLVAREIARILRIPHWEAPSVYDVQKAEWPRDFEHAPVLVVDDLIDTGTASSLILKELERRNAKCAGVLAVLASEEGQLGKARLNDIPVVTLFKVSLGRPTKEEVDVAESRGLVLDIDPHTLEPRSRKFNRPKTGARSTGSALAELARYGGLRSGHFVYGGHHYYEFFDIIRYMDSPRGFEDLWNWFKDAIGNWYSRMSPEVESETDANSVAIVYPYYSPIAAFLHRVRPLLQEAFKFPVSIHVAQPYQRSRQRIGYRLDSLTNTQRLAVFIDDGIASGSTLTEVVDAFVSIQRTSTALRRPTPRKREAGVSSRSAFLALPVFDRIGMTPSKHLRSIREYCGDVHFEFHPKYSVNLRAFSDRDCPICRVRSDLESIFRNHSHVGKQLGVDLAPIRKMFDPTYLTAIATKAPMCEMGLLRNVDTAAVVNASDALFSDQVSGAEIKKSICEGEPKSLSARLEILLHVMMDPILFRSVHDEEFFSNTVKEFLWRDEVSCNYRSYFLLHLPYVHSVALAKSILHVDIPKSLYAVPEPIRIRRGDGLCGTIEPMTPTRYFDESPSVFASIVGAIWILQNREPLESAWDREWRRALGETPYWHQLTCGTSLTSEDAARAFAEMLLCNFVTHYKLHNESLQRRIENFRNDIGSDIRTHAIPRHTLSYLAHAIKQVREYYDLSSDQLTDIEMDEIVSLSGSWLEDPSATDRGRLRELLTVHFAPEQSIYDPTISKILLNELAPEVETILDRAVADFESRVKLDNLSDARKLTNLNNTTERKIYSLRVFGNTKFHYCPVKS